MEKLKLRSAKAAVEAHIEVLSLKEKFIVKRNSFSYFFPGTQRQRKRKENEKKIAKTNFSREEGQMNLLVVGKSALCLFFFTIYLSVSFSVIPGG